MTRPADRCPGVFATHAAADGQLARLRLSGGRITPEQFEALAEAAEEYGDGHLEITGRANLQVRGIAGAHVDAFAARLVEAGLAGAASHDRVRNVTVSPFTGRIGGPAALWTAADRLDRALAETEWAQQLSGRFWFGFDDGRGDVLRRRPDVVGVADGEKADGGEAELVVAGRATGRSFSFADLPGAMLEVAEHFLAVRTDEWRIADLPEPLDLGPSFRRSPFDRASSQAPASRWSPFDRASSQAPPRELRTRAVETTPRVGWFAQDDGRVLLGAVAPFGRFTAQQARFAAAVGAPLIVTAEKELLITDLTEDVAETVVRVLAPLGFVFDANSPWTRVSACTGSPGCAKSHADVHGLLTEYLATGGAVDGREHWVGCERRCGTPPGARVRVHPESAADVG